jgi:hypothetical protein
LVQEYTVFLIQIESIGKGLSYLYPFIAILLITPKILCQLSIKNVLCKDQFPNSHAGQIDDGNNSGLRLDIHFLLKISL